MIDLIIKTNGSERRLKLPVDEQSVPGITEKNSVTTVMVINEPESLRYLVGKQWNVDELNFLAKMIESFDNQEESQFNAAVSYLQPQSIKDLITLSFNLPRYSLISNVSNLASHGGGAFSGKDPTKVDRSGAYMARYIAKTIVRTGLAKRCEIAISYAIGKAKPVAVAVNTFGTSEMSNEAIAEIVNRVYNMSPGSIIERLGLYRPIFSATAQYGHFHPDFPWELEDLSAQLFQAVADGSRQKPREFDTSAFFESAMRKK